MDDAYTDSRFNKEIHRQTGFRTRTILSLPLKNRRGGVFAVAQLLNRRDGRPFDAEDERKFQFMESIGTLLEPRIPRERAHRPRRIGLPGAGVALRAPCRDWAAPLPPAPPSRYTTRMRP